MSELTDWLLEQIAADEQTARAATPGPWRLVDLPGGNEVWADRDPAGHDAFMVATTATRLNPAPGTRGYAGAAHIAAHDPGRVLALCAAHRRIVEDFEAYAADYRDAPSDFAAGRRHAALLAVTRVAEGYSDRPGFKDEWRP